MKRREFFRTAGIVSAALMVGGTEASAHQSEVEDRYVKDYLEKMRNFNRRHEDDMVVTGDRLELLKSCRTKLARIQRVVGYGNFNILGFDDALKVARNYDSLTGGLERKEIDFYEELFDGDAHLYGFYGEKVLDRITATIGNREVVKIPHTGHYLFKGEPVRVYEAIRKQMGDTVVLTSGVRGVAKQMYLFVNKAVDTGGNLSMASRSLAPPGYSFHGAGDFDVGKKGFGYRNFTEDFARTDEYKKLRDLGYIDIRYPMGNLYGVRYEPWHVKVV